MTSLLWSLITEAATALIAGEVRRAVREAVAAAITWIIAGVFGLAALAFLYVLLYRWLAESLGDERAAAILVGVNLLLIGLTLAGRALFLAGARRHARVQLKGDAADALKVGEAGLEAGVALGAQIGEKLKKSAPEIALVAGIAGLIIGLRPQILGLFDRKKPQDGKR